MCVLKSFARLQIGLNCLWDNMLRCMLLECSLYLKWTFPYDKKWNITYVGVQSTRLSNLPVDTTFTAQSFRCFIKPVTCMNFYCRSLFWNGPPKVPFGVLIMNFLLALTCIMWWCITTIVLCCSDVVPYFRQFKACWSWWRLTSVFSDIRVWTTVQSTTIHLHCISFMEDNSSGVEEWCFGCFIQRNFHSSSSSTIFGFSLKVFLRKKELLNWWLDYS